MRAMRVWLGTALGGLLLLGTTLAHAQCTMDTECKGDRVCDAGQCVSPPSANAPLVEQPYGSEAPAVAPAPAPPPVEERPIIKQDTTRRSKPLMVGGIITTATAPVSGIIAYYFFLKQSLCNIDNKYPDINPYEDCSKYDTPLYVALGTLVGAIAIGVPMIVIGAKSVPVDPAATQEAAIGPWVTPTSAGLSLRLKM